MTITVATQQGRLIDLENDKLETVAKIYFRLTGKRLSPSQLWRWRVKGCRGAKLEAVLLAGVWQTTSKAFAAFIHCQTQAASKVVQPEPNPQSRDPITERRLQAAGLLN